MERSKKTKKTSKKMIQNRKSYENENNPNWKGDSVGINALHQWVKKNKPKPDICEICGWGGNLELSNKDHLYKRNLDDFQYVHHLCHRKYDDKHNPRGGRSYSN